MTAKKAKGAAKPDRAKSITKGGGGQRAGLNCLIALRKQATLRNASETPASPCDIKASSMKTPNDHLVDKQSSIAGVLPPWSPETTAEMLLRLPKEVGSSVMSSTVTPVEKDSVAGFWESVRRAFTFKPAESRSTAAPRQSEKLPAFRVPQSKAQSSSATMELEKLSAPVAPVRSTLPFAHQMRGSADTLPRSKNAPALPVPPSKAQASSATLELRQKKTTVPVAPVSLVPRPETHPHSLQMATSRPAQAVTSSPVMPVKKDFTAGFWEKVRSAFTFKPAESGCTDTPPPSEKAAVSLASQSEANMGTGSTDTPPQPEKAAIPPASQSEANMGPRFADTPPQPEKAAIPPASQSEANMGPRFADTPPPPEKAAVSTASQSKQTTKPRPTQAVTSSTVTPVTDSAAGFWGKFRCAFTFKPAESGCADTPPQPEEAVTAPASPSEAHVGPVSKDSPLAPTHSPKPATTMPSPDLSPKPATPASPGTSLPK